MPYLEQGALYNAINYTNKVSDVSNATAVATRSRSSSARARSTRRPFVSTNATTGVDHDLRRLELRLVRGDLVHLRRVRQPDAEPRRLRAEPEPDASRAFTDGLSNTLLAAEVKTYTPAYHDCGTVPAARADRGRRPTPTSPTVLASVAAAPTSGCKVATAPAGMPGGGHTHWGNGNSFYDGFTTALPPNTKSPSARSPPTAT